MENVTFDMILQGLNTTALVVFIVLFIKGAIMPKVTVEQILKEAENRTEKVVDALKTDIKTAVKEGMKEAYADSSGFLIDNKKK